jgi:hypothetical protein
MKLRTVARLADAGMMAAVLTAIPLPAAVQIESGGITVLMADRADRSGTLKEKLVWGQKPWGRAWVENWTNPDEFLRWTVVSAAPGSYQVDVLIAGQEGAKVEIRGDLARLEFTIPAGDWQRLRVPGVLALPAGRSTLTLRLLDAGPTRIKSLELVNAADRAALDRRVCALKSPTGWLSKAGYGLMFQWGEWGYPQRGPKKPWPKMIDDFDVERFAQIVEQTGAGYVIWSATWSSFYFPAPIQAIQRALPGHTSRRDLIEEIASALARHGIRLMLYYQVGWVDKEWWQKNWDAADTERKEKFVGNLRAILEEVGARYGHKLSGLFLDDGMLFYPAPFERITKAAKAGNPDRLVSYNAWVLPKRTDFQDVCFGEGFKGSDATQPDGIWRSGPQAGLFAHGMFILDGPNWGIDEANTVIRSPIPAEALVPTIKRAMQHGQALSLDMLMYEDGSVSPESLEVLKSLKKAVRGASPGQARRQLKTTRGSE